MAAINPTNNTSLIIDEFIQHATTHLLSVSGIVNTLSLYPPIPTPSPGIVNWTGYTIPPANRVTNEIRDRIILNEIIAKPDDGSTQLETDPEINREFNENKGSIAGYKVDPEAGGFSEDVNDLVVSNIVVPAALPASLVYVDIGKTGPTASAAGAQGDLGQGGGSIFEEEGYDTEGDEFFQTLGDGNLTPDDLPKFPKLLSRPTTPPQGNGGTYEGGATVSFGKLSVVTGGKPITIGEQKAIGLTREQYLKTLNFQDGLTISNVDMSRDWATIATQYLVKKEGFTESSSWDVNAYRLGYGTDKILLDNGTIRTVLPTKEYYERTKEKKPANGDRTTREQAAKVLEMQVRTTYKDKVVGTGDAQITEADWNALNDRQRAACVSFVYNCGSFGFYPHIPAAIKAKNYIAAANGILNGPIAGGDAVYSGLVRRRAEEAGMFAYGL
jgi:GH24 family phage-related lysozyme (muramidase)